MPGTTKLQIWNLALNHVAQRPIESDSEDSLAALTCDRCWDAVRREVLQEAPWGFATVIEALSEIGGTYSPPLGWPGAYQFPAKAIAIRKVFPPVDPATGNGEIFMTQANNAAYVTGNQLSAAIRSTTGDRFREALDPTLAKRIILSVTEGAIVEYVYDVEDTTLFSPSFVTLVAYRLAADIATPLTGDSSIAVNLSTIYNKRLSIVQQLNSIGDNTRSLGDAATVDSRG